MTLPELPATASPMPTITLAATPLPTATPAPSPTATASSTPTTAATPWPTATTLVLPPTLTPAAPGGGQSQLDLWMLARLPSGAQALRVGSLSSPQPMLDYWIGLGLTRIISLNGQTLFTVARTSDGATASIKDYYKGDPRPTLTAALDQAWGEFASGEARLLAGGSPSQALANLGMLEPVLTSNCKNRACDEFYYALGLLRL